MDKNEDRYCSKCNKIFTCKVEDIAKCQCTEVEISESTAEFLDNTFYDCLCKYCLEKLNEDIKSSKQFQFPTQKEMFVEGLHYYKENGNWVFTELYHLLRGYCCQSGCRHCVYGFKKQFNDEKVLR